jgi:histidyl-tRNA synthetase
MARPRFQALPGTRDLFAPDTDRMRALVEIFADEAEKAGFGQIVSPMFEDIGVFTRIGESTDIVTKELYDFEDNGGRRIALRPEFTASVCRAYAQSRPVPPWKSWYAGPAFRQEKAQKGRYRQFDQVGAEVIGSHDPDLDTELIALASRFYARIGLDDVTLLVNTLGDKADRPRYLDALRAYFGGRIDELSEQSRATLEINPLRVLDSKRPGDAPVIADAPRLIDFISDDAATAYRRVIDGLTALAIPFTEAPRLVRGLDYYTRTTFEFTSNALDAAQNAVGGGGRYDGLVADLGGPDDPGVGFALGVDRTLLACDAESVFPAPQTKAQVFVVSTTAGTEGLEMTQSLRADGWRVARAYDGRSMKAQMKAANKSGAPVAVIIGDHEAATDTVSVRPMTGGGEQVTIGRSELSRQLKDLLS